MGEPVVVWVAGVDLVHEGVQFGLAARGEDDIRTLGRELRGNVETVKVEKVNGCVGASFGDWTEA